MTHLMAAAALFFGIHILVSGTMLRDGIVGVIGELPYKALFAATSLAAIIWMAMSFNGAVVSADNTIYWQAPIGLLHAGSLIILVATLFAVMGLTAPSVTSDGGDKAVTAAEDPATLVKGIHTITRHPFLWGAIIWAAFHTAANGDQASVIFFGTFLAVAFFGTFAIDGKRRRSLGEKWDAYAGASSNIPFAALVTGRTTFSVTELGWWRIVLALLVWGGLFVSHEWLFAVSPIPGS